MQRGIIEKLRIRNFQIHRELDLEFGPGLNVITGASGKGKTTILRAMDWNLEDEPSGFDFRHNPILAGTGKSELSKHDITSVEIVFEDGQSILRERNAKDVNRYVVNETMKLVNLKEGVPFEVRQVADIPSYCIQRQHPSFGKEEGYRWGNPYFLISDSPSEVARKINELVGLEIIDASNSRAESVVREAKGESERSAKKVEALEKQLEGMEWLEEAEVALAELNQKVRRQKKVEEQHGKLSALIERLLLAKEIQQELAHIDSAERVYLHLQSKISTYIASDTQQKRLQQIMQELRIVRDLVETLKNRLIIGEVLGRFQAKINFLRKEREKDSLHDLIVKIAKNQELLKDLQKRVKAKRALEALDEQVEVLRTSNATHEKLKVLIANIKQNQALQTQLSDRIVAQQEEYDKIVEQIEICPIFGHTINKEICRSDESSLHSRPSL